MGRHDLLYFLTSLSNLAYGFEVAGGQACGEANIHIFVNCCEEAISRQVCDIQAMQP
jgi:hypothetical protein